jgi:hypothetical protein
MRFSGSELVVLGFLLPSERVELKWVCREFNQLIKWTDVVQGCRAEDCQALMNTCPNLLLESTIDDLEGIPLEVLDLLHPDRSFLTGKRLVFKLECIPYEIYFLNVNGYQNNIDAMCALLIKHGYIITKRCASLNWLKAVSPNWESIFLRMWHTDDYREAIFNLEACLQVAIVSNKKMYYSLGVARDMLERPISETNPPTSIYPPAKNFVLRPL